MSNAIRYDALLVRELATELQRTVVGCRLVEAGLDRASLRVTLRLRAARRTDPAPPSLLWNLHPTDGALRAVPELMKPGGRLQLGTPTFIRSVTAPADERLIRIALDAPAAPAGSARAIIVELVTNQWNAVAVSADDRITAVLRERRTADRELRAGVEYVPPPRSERAGRDGPVSREEWHALLAQEPPGRRLTALVRHVAFTSPLNAPAILGDADVSADAAALDRAWERYRSLIWVDGGEPCVIRTDAGPQPYARLLGGDATRVGSLLEAFAVVRDAPPDTADLRDRALDAIAQRIDATQRRVRRLTAQQQGASADAERLRSHADLLLAQLHRVSRGAASAELDDFAGGSITVELDPLLSPAENANRMYDAARRRGRAAARLPRLIAAADREIGELEALAAQVRDESVDEAALARLATTRVNAKQADAPALPYREYRTTRGLEVRVGRGSRANDALTFRHSSPTDIWLHARDVAGAHVILRWSRSDENPAASDIAEAAALAALFSRARTSRLVAVDWTRRKWVRKPRKAAPGLVVPERVKTVFVEPDAGLEERLRAEPML